MSRVMLTFFSETAQPSLMKHSTYLFDLTEDFLKQ